MANALDNISKQWDNEVIQPLREQMIGRMLIPRNDKLSGKGIGQESVEYYTFSDLSAALTDYSLPEGVEDEDTVDLTSSTLKMMYMEKAFKIKRTTYEAALLKGIDLEDSGALAIADLVAMAENTLFIQGFAPDGTNYKINGLYQAANNTETTSKDFGTYGNAAGKLKLAIALMLADNVYGPYNLTLNPTQYMELAGSYSTSGIDEWTQVMKLLNPNGGNVGQIYVTTAVTAATGMLTGIGKKYFDFIEAQPAKYELTFDPKLGSRSPVYGSLYLASVPRVKHTNAVCTLTNI